MHAGAAIDGRRSVPRLYLAAPGSAAQRPFACSGQALAPAGVRSAQYQHPHPQRTRTRRCAAQATQHNAAAAAQRRPLPYSNKATDKAAQPGSRGYQLARPYPTPRRDDGAPRANGAGARAGAPARPCGGHESSSVCASASACYSLRRAQRDTTSRWPCGVGEL